VVKKQIQKEKKKKNELKRMGKRHTLNVRISGFRGLSPEKKRETRKSSGEKKKGGKIRRGEGKCALILEDREKTVQPDPHVGWQHERNNGKTTKNQNAEGEKRKEQRLHRSFKVQGHRKNWGNLTTKSNRLGTERKAETSTI